MKITPQSIEVDSIVKESAGWRIKVVLDEKGNFLGVYHAFFWPNRVRDLLDAGLRR